MTHEFAPNRYENAAFRRCGNSGLMLPLISLGFWQALGEPGMEEVCRQCMYTAFDSGITHFDLANNYGPPPGNSERVVGEILKDMPRDELIISTKAGYGMWSGPYGDGGSKKYLVASLDQSLQRMGLDYVDIFYHHRPDHETPLEETLAALDLIVRQGKALYVGVSSYSGARYAQAVEMCRQHDWVPITIHQPYYNMLGRGIETDLLPHTSVHGTGVIPFCPLAGGTLTDRYLDGLPPDSRQGKRGEDGQRWWRQEQEKGHVGLPGAAQRRRPGARPDPGPDGAGLDPARSPPSRAPSSAHLPSSRSNRTSPPWTTSPSATTNSPALTPSCETGH